MTSKENIRGQLKQYRAYDRQNQPYQSIDGLSEGVRKTSQRAELMKLPADFQGASVLDIGCNTGAFCFEARKRNAGKVLGVEYSLRPLFIAEQIKEKNKEKITFCHANLNHGLVSLARTIGPYKFDYVFALSIWKHVYDTTFWSIIKGFTQKACWLELNAVHDGRHYGDTLKNFMRLNHRNSEKMKKLLKEKSGALEVFYLGKTKDQGSRGCYLLIYDLSDPLLESEKLNLNSN